MLLLIAVIIAAGIFAAFCSGKQEKKHGAGFIPKMLCAFAMVFPLALSGAVSCGRTENHNQKPVPTSEKTSEPASTAATTAANTGTAATTAAAAVTGTSKTTAVRGSTSTSTTASSSDDVKIFEEPEDYDFEKRVAPEVKDDFFGNDQGNNQRNNDEPESPYTYRNGEYEADADGYSGFVHVRLTIEDDVITSITAWSDGDDPEFFEKAMNEILPKIEASASADDIDACSGATYSSGGIIEAARKALMQAMN